MTNTVIKCDSVYKIFGANAKKMLQEANGNVDAKTFQENGCIVGVNNASFEVSKGEMLVVMGLSGSGKSTLLRCISRLTDATQGDELVEKMKKEEARAAEANKLSKIISTLPSGILTFYETGDHYKLSKEQYETVCKITKIIPQRAVMGANLINFKATKIYTTNGNQITETFVNWDKEKNKCIAGFILNGSIDGEEEKITVSGEVLNFLSTGIDTRVYFIKNF